MKTRKMTLCLGMILLITMKLILTGCSKDDPDQKMSENIISFATNAVDFVEKAIVYETAIFHPNEMSVEEARKIIDDFIESGNDFAASLQKVTSTSRSKSHSKSLLKGGEVICNAAELGNFDFDGLDPKLADRIRRITKDVDDAKSALDQAFDRNELDEIEYFEALNAMRQKNNLSEAANVGFSAVMGGLAGGIQAHSIASAGSGGLFGLQAGTAVIFGKPIIVGAAVGLGTYYLVSWATSREKSGDVVSTHLTAFPWEFDKPIPAALFGDNARVAISMEGYASVLIDPLILPDDNHDMRIVFETARLSELINPGGNTLKSKASSEVCFYMEPVSSGETCNEIMFVTGVPVPANPAVGQAVTVYANVIPATSGCDITFTIVGTDGYSNTETVATNQNGQATFGIPGASKDGVFDRVTITTSNGASYMVSYYFAGGQKSVDAGSARPRE